MRESYSENPKDIVVLITIDDWEIRTAVAVMAPKGPWAAHMKCASNESEFVYSWFFNELPAVCGYCEQAVPEGVQGLMILNSDKI